MQLPRQRLDKSDFETYSFGMALTTIHLAKQNFKFSSAHFLIFDDLHAEKLHGHNYQVKVDLTYDDQMQKEQAGYFIDFNIFKKTIKAQLDLWDEHVLLPRLHPDMKYKISSDGKNYEVNFRERFYSFPVNEVIWLEITNTCVEAFSSLLSHQLFIAFSPYQIKKVRVSVEETLGQTASTVWS